MKDEISTILPERAAFQILARAPLSFVVTNPRVQENPIIYVNEGFTKATGYTRAQSVGRNCKFLQGSGTDPRASKKIRRALDEHREVMIDILNYRADGAPFWNRLMIEPLFDENDRLEYFVGVQKPLGEDPFREDDQRLEERMREVHHRVKNHLSMVVSMIRLQSRAGASDRARDNLAQRIESLGILYDELSRREGENRYAIELGAYFGRLVRAMSQLEGSDTIDLHLDVESLTVPMEAAVSLGMILCEAVGNAMIHAFAGRNSGRVDVSLREDADMGFTVRVADDGTGLPQGHDAMPDSGLGRRIIEQLAGSLGADLSVSSNSGGTVLTLIVPRQVRGI